MTFRQFAYRNVVRNRRVYAAFFLASVFSVMVFFLYSMLMFHPGLGERFITGITVVGMTAADIILYVFTLFFLFYSMRAFMQARAGEFALLLQIGMERRQLGRLLFLEMLLLGVASIGSGIAAGFAFSKYFFMIVRELLDLPELPLYVSWQPFALTAGAFLSLFLLIGFLSSWIVRMRDINEYRKGIGASADPFGYSAAKAAAGLLLLIGAYAAALFAGRVNVLYLAVLLPPAATLGTYYFFSHTVLWLIDLMRKRKSIYWRHARLVSFAETAVKIKDNANMFFIVAIVSTVAFLSVGTLASLATYTAQYRALNPLGLVYLSQPDNPDEQAHITSLEKELKQRGLAYEEVRLTVVREQSSYSGQPLNVLRESEVNRLARVLGREGIRLKPGEGAFLPYSPDAASKLKGAEIDTVLEGSGVEVAVRGTMKEMLFPAYALGTNSIVLSETDFIKTASAHADRMYTFYAFDVPEWEETVGIGLRLSGLMSQASLDERPEDLSFYFENPGSDYAVIRSTFHLLLLTGLLVAAVFLLAAGSFIYFKLYTMLDRDRRQAAVLKRLGFTDREFVKIVNRQLVPQFFLPWGLAMLHSTFAFLSLQAIWKDLADLSIVKEMALVLVAFTIIQLLYFYLIRWRYLAHIRGPV
ncbi:ABC transporter permease [Edaphobacillus lindanitolerans]|uniref:Putative ABC transport system permease protein n=1 Tax=Edaphobacillus lindanitolerans TaxID=550447 RepID=A0A1U7PMM2_9BACI|nr:ABC transporter permease [Edaphobacillus lindanitolerans]SIT91068.1 putative ABC transport system permease protein [Edaphobacillus lindanitolerans]